MFRSYDPKSTLFYNIFLSIANTIQLTKFKLSKYIDRKTLKYQLITEDFGESATK